MFVFFIFWWAVIPAVIGALGSIGGGLLSRGGKNSGNVKLKLPEPSLQERRLVSMHEALLNALTREIERNALLRLSALPVLMDIGRFNLNPEANRDLFDLLPPGVLPPVVTGENASRPVTAQRQEIDQYIQQRVARERKGKSKKRRQLMDRVNIAKNELSKIYNSQGRITETDIGIVSDVSKLDANLVEALLPEIGVNEIFKSVI